MTEFKESPAHLISSEEDEAINRVRVSARSMLEHPLNSEDLRDLLTVFDRILAHCYAQAPLLDVGLLTLDDVVGRVLEHDRLKRRLTRILEPCARMLRDNAKDDDTLRFADALQSQIEQGFR